MRVLVYDDDCGARKGGNFPRERRALAATESSTNAREVFGLSVDDGSFAIAILVWLVPPGCCCRISIC
jgi:hypothetical protein